MDPTTSTRTMDDLLLEEQVLKAFDLRQGDLTRLRQGGLPFVALNSRRRGYWRDDLVRFLSEKRTKTIGTVAAKAGDSE